MSINVSPVVNKTRLLLKAVKTVGEKCAVNTITEKHSPHLFIYNGIKRIKMSRSVHGNMF